jgi:hypothetical protein
MTIRKSVLLYKCCSDFRTKALKTLALPLAARYNSLQGMHNMPALPGVSLAPR